MNTTTTKTEVVVETTYNHLTRVGAEQIMAYCVGQGVAIGHSDLIHLTTGKPATLEMALQYVIDMLNDEHAPDGGWYHLTPDYSLALDIDEVDSPQWMPHGVDPIGGTG